MIEVALAIRTPINQYLKHMPTFLWKKVEKYFRSMPATCAICSREMFSAE
jgi:hypothetical protein